MASRVGLLAILVTRTLLAAGAGRAEAQAALLVALRQAKAACAQAGDTSSGHDAERLEREFFEQAAAEEAN